jgi:SPP1 family predicted phage head-tail adaptor
VNFGELRERVTLQSTTITIGPIGNTVPTAVNVADLWAQVRPLRVTERMTGERLAAQGGYEVMIRYREGVTPAMRFLWRGRVLNIQGIRNADERSAYLVITTADAGPDAGTT